MNKKILKTLKDRNMALAPIDEETVKRLKKISDATGQEGWAVIHAALQVLEKSLGRTVIVQSSDTNFDLRIDYLKRFPKVSGLGFDK